MNARARRQGDRACHQGRVDEEIAATAPTSGRATPTSRWAPSARRAAGRPVRSRPRRRGRNAEDGTVQRIRLDLSALYQTPAMAMITACRTGRSDEIRRAYRQRRSVGILNRRFTFHTDVTHDEEDGNNRVPSVRGKRRKGRGSGEDDNGDGARAATGSVRNGGRGMSVSSRDRYRQITGWHAGSVHFLIPTRRCRRCCPTRPCRRRCCPTQRCRRRRCPTRPCTI